MKEINGRKKWLDVTSSGFFSLLGLRIFPVVLLVCSTILSNIQYTLKTRMMQTELQLCEIYAVLYVKNALLCYEEADETISYKNYSISLVYDDITAYITISDHQAILLKSCLQWDDIDNVVVDYTYL